MTPSEWLALADDDEGCPWPGPRPLRENELDQLVGREDALNTFLNHVVASRLVHLTGLSGVGKTSLLTAGLVPALRREGYTVATCRTWDKQDNDQPFDDFLAEKLHESLDVQDRPDFPNANSDFFWDLHDTKGSRGVIILDQFEEFIRHARHHRDAALDWLLDAHDTFGFHIVLSYRAEFEHFFRRFNQDSRILVSRSQQLDAVNPKAGEELIRRGNEAAGGSAIDEGAIKKINSLWQDAVKRDTSRDGVGVGLLHLQAILYDLYHAAKGRPITKADVRNLQLQSRMIDPDDDDFDNSPLMSFALEAAATHRLRLAVEAARASRMDNTLVTGASLILARIVPLLSSGGYKIEQTIEDLLDVVLADDLGSAKQVVEDALGESEGAALWRSFLDGLIDTMTAEVFDDDAGMNDQGTVPAVAKRRSAIYEAARTDPRIIALADPQGISSGPLLGHGVSDLVVEQVRRFVWALLWLNHLDLARITTNGSNASVTLVHDGWGEPLRRWSRDYLSANETWAIRALTLPRGENHEWFGPQNSKALSGSTEAPRVHANLGLRGNSIIGATIEDAVFVNCDFRGALFLRCEFKSVTFLNCVLDGALFSDCTARGLGNEIEVLTRAEVSETQPPTYIVPTSQDVAALFGLYRESGQDSSILLAQAPGHPAIPVASGSDDSPDWEPRPGALIIHGSRLSALTVRGMRFRDEGTMVFARVRGSGLDVCEVEAKPDASDSALAVETGPSGWTPARYRFESSVLRHVAFSGHGPGRELIIDVDWCAVGQWWIGSGFAGALDSKDSLMGQVWNESGLDTFNSNTDEDCLVFDLFQVDATNSLGLGFHDQSDPLPTVPDPVTHQAMFRDRMRATDYRRV